MAAERKDVHVTAGTGHVTRAEVEQLKRQPVSLRFRSGLRDQVWKVAIEEGKTLNEAVNDLIERGLKADKHLADVFGSTEGAAVARAVIAAIEASMARNDADKGRWLRDPEHFERARQTAIQTLDMLRPEPTVQAALADVVEHRRRSSRHGQ